MRGIIRKKNFTVALVAIFAILTIYIGKRNNFRTCLTNTTYRASNFFSITDQISVYVQRPNFPYSNTQVKSEVLHRLLLSAQSSESKQKTDVSVSVNIIVDVNIIVVSIMLRDGPMYLERYTSTKY